MGKIDVTWQSALILTRRGDRIAILGHFDAENIRRLGVYEEVITYHEAFSSPLREVLQRLNPAQIAVNYSTNDSHADGLGHGMYLLLQRYLARTPFADRLISAEGIIRALRGRKTAAEVARIRQAIATAVDVYGRTFDFLRPGMTEIEVGDFIHAQVDALGLETSWERASCPAVDSGPNTPIGHAGPTDLVIEPGHIVHFDFGIRQNGYSSDLQRGIYVLKEMDILGSKRMCLSPRRVPFS